MPFLKKHHVGYYIPVQVLNLLVKFKNLNLPRWGYTHEQQSRFESKLLSNDKTKLVSWHLL